MKPTLKAKLMYDKMRAERERLVKLYEAGGTIRYDEAIGLIPVGGNPAVSQAAATVGGAPVANSGRREKRINQFLENGTAIGTRVTLDLDAIKAANIADGIPSGSMMDALKKRAEGKTILLFANDASLRYGTVILGEVKCQLKLMGDITNSIRNALFPAFQTANSNALNGVLNTGLAHALPGYVEQEHLLNRGEWKPVNYRGDVEYLKDPVSIWATTDASRQSIMLLGVNSEVRMWGEGQVIDLNGFRIGAHERPNRVAAFSCIIDLADGHFLGLSTKGAKNAHIYSSTGKGRLARCNHFSIRGHFVKGLLVENVIAGDKTTINQGSYFGTAIFNDCEEIVFKDVHQEMLNKAVSNSSMELSHYAQLANVEMTLGFFERPSTWSAATFPWMKWDSIAAGATDTYGNGKTTPLPVIKTEAELQAAGLSSAAATQVRKALLAMKAAYAKSMKSADDTYIQTNTGHNALNVVGANRAGLSMNAAQQMTDVKQIPRSANLVAQNPRNEAGFRYPDSVAYGFRAGSTDEGVGALSIQRGGTIRDIYIMDCTFASAHINPMETLTIGVQGKGAMKTFNGSGLRPFGYMNALADAAGMAPALVLVSKDAMHSNVPGSQLEPHAFETYDTALKAVTNYTGSSAWTAVKAHGLYKGSDVAEAGLAAIEAIQLLKKYFTAAAPQAQLSGIDNSNVDIGILALRKSMMQALGASTACHVGLKGGYQGDIFMDDGTYYGYGEIYPWMVKEDGSVDIDKDVILQDPQARSDRRQTDAYLAAQLPDLSDSIYKLKWVATDTLELVTADTETPVTYEQCIALLGFGSGTGPVQYTVIRQADGQNHVHKGLFGVRVDQASSVVVQNVVVRDFETEDAKAPTAAFGSYFANVQFGFSTEETLTNDSVKFRGVSLNGVLDAEVKDIVVEECSSRGTAIGVEIAGKSADIEIEGLVVKDLKSGFPGELKAFGEQESIGLRVVKGSQVTFKDVEVEGLIADEPTFEKPVKIEAL